MIFDIFCDASISVKTKTACGGCFIISQDENGKITEVGFKRVLQLNATNNSSEILAIYTGVLEALALRAEYPDAIFRLFSDSSISILGLRDWMEKWINNITEDGVLIASNNLPVQNQQIFIDIYNTIVLNGLKIRLFHQRGHINENVPIDYARIKFIRSNLVTPESLGLSMELLAKYNNMIDHLTRDAVSIYLSQGILAENTEFEKIEPIALKILDSALPIYKRLIS